MPEPVILRTLHSDRYPEAPYLVHGFTADQVRAAILGATERAAKLCEQLKLDAYSCADMDGSHHVLGMGEGAEACAAAIRGTK
jgi:hypothetical protein